MKRIAFYLSLALAATLAASADRFAPATGSSVRIEGTSTLHAWTMEGTKIDGTIEASTPDQWNGQASVVATIPVQSIKSEHAKMDKLMAQALKAEQFPTIRYELTEASPKPADAASYVMKTRGKLTIAGVTRELSMDVQAVRGADGRYTLTGQAPIRMTHFGITPPKAMMNTIRTGDDVKVTFRWIVGPAK